MSSQLFLAPCSKEHKDQAYENFKGSVLDGVSSELYPSLVKKGFSDQLSIWGVVSGNKSIWERIRPGDVVLFYTKSRTYTHAAEVVDTEKNETLGESLWQTYDGKRLVRNLDEPWPYLIYLSNVQRVSICSEELHNELGYSTYYPQSFMRPADKRQQQIVERHGTLAELLESISNIKLSGGIQSIAEEEKALERAVEDEPELHDDSISTVTERQIRTTAFNRKIRSLYDNACCVCGAKRRSPDGTPEVKPTYIYPRSENGKTDLRNGVTLCKLHHWAFKSGWISLSDDYSIVVKDAVDMHGYEEFSRLKGQVIILPDGEDFYPHPKYLEAHRTIHGFGGR